MSVSETQIEQGDIDVFTRSLQAQGTPWALGCEALILNLWREARLARSERVPTSRERMEQVHQSFDAWLKKVDPLNLFVTCHGFAREAWQDATQNAAPQDALTRKDGDGFAEADSPRDGSGLESTTSVKSPGPTTPAAAAPNPNDGEFGMPVEHRQFDKQETLGPDRCRMCGERQHDGQCAKRAPGKKNLSCRAPDACTAPNCLCPLSAQPWQQETPRTDAIAKYGDHLALADLARQLEREFAFEKDQRATAELVWKRQVNRLSASSAIGDNAAMDAIQRVLNRRCTNPQPIGDSACDCCQHHWHYLQQYVGVLPPK